MTFGVGFFWTALVLFAHAGLGFVRSLNVFLCEDLCVDATCFAELGLDACEEDDLCFEDVDDLCFFGRASLATSGTVYSPGLWTTPGWSEQGSGEATAKSASEETASDARAQERMVAGGRGRTENTRVMKESKARPRPEEARKRRVAERTTKGDKEGRVRWRERGRSEGAVVWECRVGDKERESARCQLNGMQQDTFAARAARSRRDVSNGHIRGM